MRHTYLEVTFRKGKPLAAYLYLPRRTDDKSARVESACAGMNVDYAADGRAIGIEILTPRLASVESLNALLRRLQLPPVEAEELGPLAVA
jgi:hypothetical protein